MPHNPDLSKQSTEKLTEIAMSETCCSGSAAVILADRCLIDDDNSIALMWLDIAENNIKYLDYSDYEHLSMLCKKYKLESTAAWVINLPKAIANGTQLQHASLREDNLLEKARERLLKEPANMRLQTKSQKQYEAGQVLLRKQAARNKLQVQSKDQTKPTELPAAAQPKQAAVVNISDVETDKLLRKQIAESNQELRELRLKGKGLSSHYKFDETDLAKLLAYTTEHLKNIVDIKDDHMGHAAIILMDRYSNRKDGHKHDIDAAEHYAKQACEYDINSYMPTECLLLAEFYMVKRESSKVFNYLSRCITGCLRASANEANKVSLDIAMCFLTDCIFANPSIYIPGLHFLNRVAIRFSGVERNNKVWLFNSFKSNLGPAFGSYVNPGFGILELTFEEYSGPDIYNFIKDCVKNNVKEAEVYLKKSTYAKNATLTAIALQTVDKGDRPEWLPFLKGEQFRINQNLKNGWLDAINCITGANGIVPEIYFTLPMMSDRAALASSISIHVLSSKPLNDIASQHRVSDLSRDLNAVKSTLHAYQMDTIRRLSEAGHVTDNKIAFVITKTAAMIEAQNRNLAELSNYIYSAGEILQELRKRVQKLESEVSVIEDALKSRGKDSALMFFNHIVRKMQEESIVTTVIRAKRFKFDYGLKGMAIDAVACMFSASSMPGMDILGQLFKGAAEGVLSNGKLQESNKIASIGTFDNATKLATNIATALLNYNGYLISECDIKEAEKVAEICVQAVFKFIIESKREELVVQDVVYAILTGFGMGSLPKKIKLKFVSPGESVLESRNWLGEVLKAYTTDLSFAKSAPVAPLRMSKKELKDPQPVSSVTPQHVNIQFTPALQARTNTNLGFQQNATTLATEAIAGRSNLKSTGNKLFLG